MGDVLAKPELRAIHAALARHGELPEVQDRIAHILAARAGEREWGARVFRIELPLESAPSLNQYANMETWQKAKLRKRLDLLVLQAAQLQGGIERLRAKGPRAARVTRHTPWRMDELSTDACGGKAPLDRLVKSGILTGDNPDQLKREAAWTKCSPGDSRVVIEVFELV